MSWHPKVAIIGVGMVGTPIRCWLESEKNYVLGVDLFCYDTDPKLGYTEYDYNEADLVFVAVPTSMNPNGSCNTSIVKSVVSQLTGSKIVVIKSTVPPGTTDSLQEEYPGHRFLFCPEFLTEKQAWLDFRRPYRQIIGTTPQSRGLAADILTLLPEACFTRPTMPIYGQRLEVSAMEAELAKYASNVFAAVKVAFGNVLSDVCWGLSQVMEQKVDYEHLRDMVGADPRIGGSWLNVDHGSYNGFGGYCLPKDLMAFIMSLRELVGKVRCDTTEEQQMRQVLEDGLHILEAVYRYNSTLLAAQNLAVKEVIRHDTAEIVKAKRRPIRQLDEPEAPHE